MDPGGIVLLTVTADLTGLPTSRRPRPSKPDSNWPCRSAGRPGRPLAERAGVVNIGLEGMMILGTWGAAWAGYQWGPWAAVVGGSCSARSAVCCHAVATVTFGVNHIVSGVAINLLGAGVAKYCHAAVHPVSHNPSSREGGSFDTYSPSRSGLLADLRSARYVVSDWPASCTCAVRVSPLTMIAILLVPATYCCSGTAGSPAAAVLRETRSRPSPRRQRVPAEVHRVTVSGASPARRGVSGPGQTATGKPDHGAAANRSGRMIFGNWRPGACSAARRCSATRRLQTLTDGKTVLACLRRALLDWVIALVQLIRRK